jgi:hypothetical protein
MKQFLAKIVGADIELIEAHKPAARNLTYAIAIMLLFVTFPISFLGGFIYSLANLVPLDWPTGIRILSAALIGCGWASMITFAVDRSLLIVADAIGSDRRWPYASMLALRFAVAIVLANLVADEIIHWWYRAQIMEMSQHMSLEKREMSAKQLNEIHGIPRLHGEVAIFTKTMEQLEAQKNNLPAGIQNRFVSAKKCDDSALRLQAGLYAVHSDGTENTAQKIADLRQQYAQKRRECAMIWRDAQKTKDAYDADISAKIQKNTSSLTAVNSRLNAASAKAQDEIQKNGEEISTLYADGSARDMSFARVKKENSDVLLYSWGIKAGLLLLELLPLLIKTLLINNPISAEIRAILEEEAAIQRNRANASRIAEFIFNLALGDEEMQKLRMDADKTVIAAAQPMDSLFRLLDRMYQTEKKVHEMTRRYPESTIEVCEALSTARARSFAILA